MDNETLGGATTHCEISGVTDYKHPNDQACLDSIRNIMDKTGDYIKAGFDRAKPAKPLLDEKEIYGILPENREKPYDMYDIIKRLLDNSEFEEYKAGYGQSYNLRLRPG